ncbi:MAG: M6 family metalloprotease domain-containing protein [Bacteroidales bacterium]|nr:M6 family metalloprotease domain-containing protein [Bacteroidales bacterium]
MKRILTFILFALGVGLGAWAGPAYPGPIAYTQPDGTVITIWLHGDENFSWVTSADGTVLEMDVAGYYRKAADQHPQPSVEQAIRLSRARRVPAAPETPPAVGGNGKLGFGNQHYLCVLVEFSDLYFKLDDPQAEYTSMLNDKGYSKHGGRGSFRDYFQDTSGGLFEPTFDVAGPVRLSKSYREYGGNGTGSPNGYREAVGFFEALSLLDEQGFDFSPYDNDGNSEIDFVFFIFAGYSAAESGNYYLIWPHQWHFKYYSEFYNHRFDGLRPGIYACGAELKGAYGTNMSGIGTICHEFGHALGLPDFYDVDGASNGTLSWSLGGYSIMCYGPYNGDGTCPPYYNALERYLVGWQDFPQEIAESGSYSLENVQSGQAYALKTTMEGEYFLLDAHDATGWDAPLQPGLLLYHYDRSNVKSYVGSMTPYAMWERGVPNNYAAHPCFYIRRANAQNQESWPFPGQRRVSSYTTEDWSGAQSWAFRNIAYADGKVSFDLSFMRNRVLGGTVRSGNTGTLALPGAVITVSGEGVEPVSATTDRSGKYSLTVPDTFPVRVTVTVSCPPFRTETETFDYEQGTRTVSFYLEPEGEMPDDLSLLGFTHLGGLPEHPAVGTEFTPEVLPALGKTVASVRWTFDERSATGPSFTLPRSGKTRLMADITYTDGSTEQVVAVFIAQ